MFKVDVKVDRALTRFGKLPDDVRARLKAEAQELAAMLKSDARDKASGPVIAVRTGKFRRSIRTRVTATKTKVTGKLFSKDPRARIFEWGGTIPAHVIEVKNARALHFVMAGGGELYAMKVNNPGGTIAQRSVIHATFDEKRADITEGLKEALAVGIKDNATAP